MLSWPRLRRWWLRLAVPPLQTTKPTSAASGARWLPAQPPTHCLCLTASFAQVERQKFQLGSVRIGQVLQVKPPRPTHPCSIPAFYTVFMHVGLCTQHASGQLQ